MKFTLFFYKIMMRTLEFTYNSFLFPSRKLIAYCMRKREPSDSLKYILVMLLFPLLLAHILFIFGSGNLKTKSKTNHIHPLLSL
uniref:Uncharacterized protein n=1 Tax=Canis lupus dingo TaxID=286419 RepID=A0A8C0QUV9_CANLU